MTTYIISKSDEEIRGKSFVYVIMKKLIGDNGKYKINSKSLFMCFKESKYRENVSKMKNRRGFIKAFLIKML